MAANPNRLSQEQDVDWSQFQPLEQNQAQGDVDWDQFEPVEQTDLEQYKSRPLTERVGESLERGGKMLGAGFDALSMLNQYGQLKSSQELVGRQRQSLEQAQEDLQDMPQEQRQFAMQQFQQRLEGAQENYQRNQESFVQNIQDMHQRLQEAGEIPMNPAAEKAIQADTWDEAWGHFKEDPLGVISGIGIQSLPLSAPGMVTGVAGGLAGGPWGYAAGQGAGSAGVEFALSLANELEEQGADLSDPESIRETLDEHEEEIKANSAKRGLAIGALDLVGGKLVTTRLTPRAGSGAGAGTRAASGTAETGAQLTGQMTTGATGEAIAQRATGEWRPGEIGAEAVGELIGAPIEVGGAVISGARQQAGQRTQEGRPTQDEQATQDTQETAQPVRWDQFTPIQEETVTRRPRYPEVRAEQDEAPTATGTRDPEGRDDTPESVSAVEQIQNEVNANYPDIDLNFETPRAVSLRSDQAVMDALERAESERDRFAQTRQEGPGQEVSARVREGFADFWRREAQRRGLVDPSGRTPSQTEQQQEVNWPEFTPIEQSQTQQVQQTDVVTRAGAPYRSRESAERAASVRNVPDYQPIQVDQGWVLRPPQTQEPTQTTQQADVETTEAPQPVSTPPAQVPSRELDFPSEQALDIGRSGPAVAIREEDGSREVIQGRPQGPETRVVDISRDEHQQMRERGHSDREIAYAAMSMAGEDSGVSAMAEADPSLASTGPDAVRSLQRMRIPMGQTRAGRSQRGAFGQQPRRQDPVLQEAKRRAGLGRRRPLRDFVRRLQEVTWDQAKNILSEGRGRLAQGTVDRFHGIKRFSQRIGNLPAEQDPYVAARMTTGMASVMRALLNHGAPRWQDGIIQRVEGSKSLLGILDPVKGELDTFLGWMVARRAQRLKEEGREQNLSQAQINALIKAGEDSQNFSQYEAVANEIAEFKGHVLDVAEQAGLIDPEARAVWDHADYIPFYRVAEESGKAEGPRSRAGLSGQTAGIRRLTGGQQQLNDPLENMIMNFTHLMDAAMKNHAVRQVRDLDQQQNDAVLEKATQEFKPEMVPLPQIRTILEERGVDTSLIPPEAMQGLQKMWAMKPPQDRDVIRVMDNGKAEYYRVHDPILLRALTAVRDPGLQHPIVNTMRSFKRVLTRGVTSDPAFMIRNFMRDSLHAWTINEDRFRVGVDSIRGVTKTLSESGGLIDMMFAGGSFQGGYVNANDPGATARAIRGALRQQGYSASARENFMSTVVDTPLKFWEKYTRIGDAVENASREAVYEAGTQAGKSKAQAVFEAKDLMDYSMRGDWAIMQFMGDVLPFFNARIQGLYKLGRAGARHPGRMLARGSMITLAALGLLALNYRDERYKELPDWDKDTYWHIFMPESVVGSELSHIRIPKPFEVGVLFGTIPERWAMNMLDRDDNEKTFERMLWSIRETFAFDPVPQAFNPMLEVWGNRDRFRDAPIEGMGDEGRLPEARYDERTSETARALGEVTGPMMGMSPKQLEHLWRGYTGSMGMYLLDMSDLAVRSVQDLPPRPGLRIDEMPVIGSFLRSDPARSTQYLTDLYDLHQEANQIYQTVRNYRRTGNEERARELLEKERPMLQARNALRTGADASSEISRRLDQIRRSEDMSPEEKRREIDRLIERRNEMARRAVERAREITEE